jgi:hypothetical protein
VRRPIPKGDAPASGATCRTHKPAVDEGGCGDDLRRTVVSAGRSTTASGLGPRDQIVTASRLASAASVT